MPLERHVHLDTGVHELVLGGARHEDVVRRDADLGGGKEYMSAISCAKERGESGRTEKKLSRPRWAHAKPSRFGAHAINATNACSSAGKVFRFLGGSDAHLTGVHEPAPQDATCSELHVASRINDNRALACKIASTQPQSSSSAFAGLTSQLK